MLARVRKCFNIGLLLLLFLQTPHLHQFGLSYLSLHLREGRDQTNFEIEASFGVEASQLYPDVKYTPVGEFLNQFV